MRRFDPYLPIIGVVGLIVVWYLAVWYQVVDPVLLPSPIDTFRALWSGMTGSASISCGRWSARSSQR